VPSAICGIRMWCCSWAHARLPATSPSSPSSCPSTTTAPSSTTFSVRVPRLRVRLALTRSGVCVGVFVWLQGLCDGPAAGQVAEALVQAANVVCARRRPGHELAPQRLAAHPPPRPQVLQPARYVRARATCTATWTALHSSGGPSGPACPGLCSLCADVWLLPCPALRLQ